MSKTTSFFRQLPLYRVIALIMLTCFLMTSVMACSNSDDPTDDTVIKSSPGRLTLPA